MSFWGDLEDAASDLWDDASSAFSGWIDDLKDDGEELVEDAKDSWNDAWHITENALKNGNILGAIVGAIGGIVGGIVAVAGNAVDFIFDAVGSTLGALVALAGALVGGILRITIILVTLGAASGFAEDVGDFFTELGQELGDGISWVFHLAGDFVERLFDIAAGLIFAATNLIRCMLNSIGGASRHSQNESKLPEGFKKTKHFFVLMLENRSFDHMLGQSTIPGIDGVLGATYANSGINAGGNARFRLRAGPPHEFAEVQAQLGIDSGVPNGGFVSEYVRYMVDHLSASLNNLPEDAAEVMRGFTADRLPVLHALATQFAVCDHWYSSVPGPTLTNRQFVHAATAGGMADSPWTPSLGWSMTMGGFEYENGTLFDRLDDECIRWRIYAGDLTPLVLTLKGMASDDYVALYQKIKSLDDDFRLDVLDANKKFPNYIFIEPDYGHFWSDFTAGDSQHPLGSVNEGEVLIKNVYEALRASPIWESSALIILYDEHGGFFDHEVPPSAPNPGDARYYQDWCESPSARAFQFDRLGPRVPAIVVSPYVDAGKICDTHFDHTSVIATMRKRFGFRHLTERDLNAKTFEVLFSRQQPRTDTPALLPNPLPE